MNVRCALPSDSAQLAEFYQSFQLGGPVQMEVQRGEDFFAFYKKLGSAYRTYILEDSDGLQGIASFIIFDRLFLGKPIKIAYALDLRIRRSRAAIREWSQHFQPILEELKAEEGCEYFFSSLHKSQVQAYNAFVRPRQAKRQLPRYHLFRQFRFVSVHGRLPFSPAPLKSLILRRAIESDRTGLTEYLAANSSGRPIRVAWEQEGLEQSLSHFPGLKLEDFYVAVTKQGKIVGSAAPWSLNGLKDFVPLSYTARAENFRQILKFGSLLRFAHSLPKPTWKNPGDAAFRFRLLTHLRADNEDIFDSLMTHIWDEILGDEFLIYTHFDSEYWLNPSKHFVTTTQVFSLYSIVPGGASLPDQLTPIDESPVDLELSSLVY